jgi:hypothetical protein
VLVSQNTDFHPTISYPVKHVISKDTLSNTLDNDIITNSIEHIDYKHLSGSLSQEIQKQSIVFHNPVDMLNNSLGNDHMTNTTTILTEVNSEDHCTSQQLISNNNGPTVNVNVPWSENYINMLIDDVDRKTLSNSNNLYVNDNVTVTTNGKQSYIDNNEQKNTNDSVDGLTFLHLLNFSSQIPAPWDVYCLEPRPL